MTTVGALSWPAPVDVARAPSIHTSHRFFAADQVNRNDAAGKDTEYELTRSPPAGGGPNRSPMSCARLAPGASRSSWRVSAYRLYGANRLALRKYPPTMPAYRSPVRACSTTGVSVGVAPDQANAGRTNWRSS